MSFAFLFRKIFTWYSFPYAENRMIKALYVIIFLGSLFLGFMVLPLIAKILLILFPKLMLQPFYSNQIVELTVMIVCFLGFISCISIFKKLDKKYANRCPHCKEKMKGPFKLGKTCCGEFMNSWLLAPY
jgi:hypothetical protein